MVVDSRPDLRGVNVCERLTEADIPCSYVYINSATYVMKDQVSCGGGCGGFSHDFIHAPG